jgi:hypothetical protein
MSFNPVSKRIITKYFNYLFNSSRKAAASMKIMDGYIKTCRFPDKNDSYVTLIKGVKTLYVKLCQDGSFWTGSIYSKIAVKLQEF